MKYESLYIAAFVIDFINNNIYCKSMKLFEWRGEGGRFYGEKNPLTPVVTCRMYFNLSMGRGWGGGG